MKRSNIELIYSDPSAAYDAAASWKSKGAYRVTVTPENGKHILRVWTRF